MLGVRLESHQVDHVDQAHLQLREVLAQQFDGGQRLQGGHVSAAGEHHVRLGAAVVAGPLPDAQATAGVLDRLGHRQPVRRRLLTGHHHVDVVPAAQAVVHRGEQRVRVRWQIDPHHLGLLVDDVVDEARVLVGEAVVVLPPDVAGEQVVQRGDRLPPGDGPGHLQPLGVLVEHRVDDVDERLVAGEHTVPAGQQVALQPALAQVLGEHLHDPPVRGEVVVAGHCGGNPDPVGHLERGAQPVGRDLVRAEQPERLRVGADDVTDPRAEHPCRAGDRRTRFGNLHAVVAEVRQGQVAQHHAAVGDRVGAHPPVTARRQRQELVDRRAGRVEQLLRPVAAQPVLQLGQVRRVVADARQRHLMGAVGALHLGAVDLTRAGPALRRPQNDHWPAGTFDDAPGAGPPLDLGDLVQHAVQRRREGPMHLGGIVAGHHVRLVARPAQEVEQVALGDPGQHGRVGDLVAVEVQDGQHRAVARRIEEHVGEPAAGQRPGLRLTVADHAGHQQVRVVERGAVGVAQRVPQLAALVDRTRHVRRHVAGDAAREGELAEELGHPGLVARHVVVALRPGALQPGVGHDGRASVAGAGDQHGVEVARHDHPVEVGVDQVEAGAGAPVPEQSRLDVVGGQRLAQQRIVQQVDLPDGEVVRGAPVGVQPAQLVVGEGAVHVESGVHHAASRG